MTFPRKKPSKAHVTSIRIIVRQDRDDKTLASASATLDPAAVRGLTPREILDRLLGKPPEPRPKH